MMGKKEGEFIDIEKRGILKEKSKTLSLLEEKDSRKNLELGGFPFRVN